MWRVQNAAQLFPLQVTVLSAVSCKEGVTAGVGVLHQLVRWVCVTHVVVIIIIIIIIVIIIL
jgi:hypothetical protein